jgi:DNA polymerase III epsilon subunit-like protein
VIQVVFLPLDNKLNPRKDLPPFDIRLRPMYIDRIDAEALRISRQRLEEIIESGIDQEKGLELFEHWFGKLNLPMNKRIMPLGYNISLFDLPFIRYWFDVSGLNYEEYISYVVRDGMQVCTFLNDVSDFCVEQTPFNKLRLTYVAKKLDIEVFDQGVHDPLYDAFLAAEIYKKLLHHHLLNPI